MGVLANEGSVYLMNPEMPDVTKGQVTALGVAMAVLGAATVAGGTALLVGLAGASLIAMSVAWSDAKIRGSRADMIGNVAWSLKDNKPSVSE